MVLHGTGLYWLIIDAKGNFLSVGPQLLLFGFLKIKYGAFMYQTGLYSILDSMDDLDLQINLWTTSVSFLYKYVRTCIAIEQRRGWGGVKPIDL